MGMNVDNLLMPRSSFTADVYALYQTLRFVAASRLNRADFVSAVEIIRLEGQLRDFDTQRIGHGVCQSRTGRGDAAFASAFDA